MSRIIAFYGPASTCGSLCAQLKCAREASQLWRVAWLWALCIKQALQVLAASLHRQTAHFAVANGVVARARSRMIGARRAIAAAASAGNISKAFALCASGIVRALDVLRARLRLAGRLDAAQRPRRIGCRDRWCNCRCNCRCNLSCNRCFVCHSSYFTHYRKKLQLFSEIRCKLYR